MQMADMKVGGAVVAGVDGLPANDLFGVLSAQRPGASGEKPLSESRRYRSG